MEDEKQGKVMMLRSFQAAVVATTWVMLLLGAKIPQTFFGNVYFSYVAYFCFAMAIAALVLWRKSSYTSVKWADYSIILLLVVPVLLAGLHGAVYVEETPSWLVLDDTADYRNVRFYLRTFVFQPLMQPGLAFLISIAVSAGLQPRRILFPVLFMIAVISILVIGYVAIFGGGFDVIANSTEENRAEYLSEAGFHANAFGAILVYAFALLLGMARGACSLRHRLWLACLQIVTVVAILLCLSRGAILAVTILSILYYWRSNLRRKTIFVIALLVVWYLAPALIFQRFSIGLDSGHINDIGTGRVDYIWLPLLPDILDNLLLGQGINSIMWTNAQQMSLIFPVGMAHNAYLDLFLDLGIIGAIPVLGFYAYVWRRFIQLSTTEKDRYLRGIFYGGHLMMTALFILGVTNDRFTPFSTHFMLWIVIGILLGRLAEMKMQQRQAKAAPYAKKVYIRRFPRRKLERNRCVE